MMWRYSNRQRYEDYCLVFNGEVGQRVLLDLCRSHRVFSSTFHKDARISTLNEGERNAILRILTILSYTEKELVQLSQTEVEMNDENFIT